jgi:hypothetical protein
MYLLRWYLGVLKRDMYLNKISVHFSNTTNYMCCSHQEMQQATYFFNTNRQSSLSISAAKDQNTIAMNPIFNHHKLS